MIRALYSAASGMSAQQLNIDNIANNLANANTVGYKSRRAQFQDLMYQTLVQPGSQSGATTLVPSGLQLGLGTRTSSNEIMFSQGAFTNTTNPLDMVIQGNGFFQIKQATGETAYTRAGSFQMDATGNIVTPTAIQSCPRSRFRRPRNRSTSRPMEPSVTRFPDRPLPRSPGKSLWRTSRIPPASTRSARVSICLPTRPARRSSALLAARTAPGQSCRATSNNRTSAWWMNSST